MSPLTVIPEDYSLATAADDVLQIMVRYPFLPFVLCFSQDRELTGCPFL